MDAVIGIFSDVPAGTVILIAVLACLAVKFSAPNLFKDSGSNKSESRSSSQSGSRTSDSV